MAVAQVGGANIGSRFAISNGEKVVRPVLVIVSICFCLGYVRSAQVLSF